MSKPFDTMLNTLIGVHEEDWARHFGDRAGISSGAITSLDTDLASNLQADRLFLIGDGESKAVLHLELESSGKLGRPAKLLRYNVAAWAQYDAPVHSVLIVLRPKGNARDLSGEYQVADVRGRPYLSFRYTVVRLWEESVEGLLDAGLGVAPLALLTNEAADDLPRAFSRFLDRLRVDRIDDSLKQGLLSSAYVLCGLRYSPEEIERLYREMSMILEDSSTYQLILNKGVAVGREEGRAEEARRLLLRLGTHRFKAPSPSVEAAIAAISDSKRIERLVERVLDASGWDDLLTTA